MILNRKKVMIVDPSPIFRRKLKAVILTNETLVDVIEADTINAAEGILRNQPLDVLFLDLGFPQDDGIRLIDAINGATKGMRLVVLASYDSAAVREAGLQDRVDCFLPKEHAVGLRLADVIHEMIRRQ